MVKLNLKKYAKTRDKIVHKMSLAIIKSLLGDWKRIQSKEMLFITVLPYPL
jgi:hypothetical protein